MLRQCLCATLITCGDSLSRRPTTRCSGAAAFYSLIADGRCRSTERKRCPDQGLSINVPAISARLAAFTQIKRCIANRPWL